VVIYLGGDFRITTPSRVGFDLGGDLICVAISYLGGDFRITTPPLGPDFRIGHIYHSGVSIGTGPASAPANYPSGD